MPNSPLVAYNPNFLPLSTPHEMEDIGASADLGQNSLGTVAAGQMGKVKAGTAASASFSGHGSSSVAALYPVSRGSRSSAAVFPVGHGSSSSSAVFPFRHFNSAAGTSASSVVASSAAVCWDPVSSASSMAPFPPWSPSFGHPASWDSSW